MGNFGISEGNITRRKKKNRDYIFNRNSQQRSSPDAHIYHQRGGLNREARAASSVLRVRTRPDCPEDNLRELMGDSNPNCGIAIGRGKQKKNRTFPRKVLTLTRSLARSQHEGLSKHQKRASQLCTGHSPLPEAQRQACHSQSQKARGILGPRDQHPSPNCEQTPSC